jgi:polysaccharide biosynthesis protein PslH
MRVLLFTHRRDVAHEAGRERLTRLNRRIIEELFADSLFVIEASPGRVHSIAQAFSAIAGGIDGLDQKAIADCLCMAGNHNVDVIYIEGSNYGLLAKRLKRAFPDKQIVTFFHNVESRFFLGAFKARPSIRAGAVLFANWLAESYAVKHSDRIVCLNERDSRLLRRVYGRGATDISALALDSSVSVQGDDVIVPGTEPFGIFVGAAFYASVSGVDWFARKVAPNITCKIYVIGRDFEKYADRWERFANMKVVGTVNDVGEWYRRASFVIAPIFDGSGMKTKIAEALMHGKRLIGTAEAFVGYEDVPVEAGIICDTADEFSAAIEHALASPEICGSAELRALFDQRYSFEAAKSRLARTFDKLL